MSSPEEEDTDARRGAGAFYALVALILLALPVGWYAFLYRPPPPPPPPLPPPPKVEAPAAPAPVELRLAQVEGTVELRRDDGTWRKVEQGTALKTSDSVRTLDGSVAVLVGGEAWEVRMEPGTEVAVDDLTASISRLMLQNGMATARVKGDARHSFEVRAAGSDAVAKTSSGEFAISNNGAGTVAVGTREGEVELSGSGKVVIVRAGQQSVVRPGKGPSAPTEIPSTLLLKVNWPKSKVLTRSRVLIAGQTAPGAHVEIAGKVVRAGADGRFSSRIALTEGKQKLEVKAISVGGARAVSDRDVDVDTRVDGSGFDRLDWGAKKSGSRPDDR